MRNRRPILAAAWCAAFIACLPAACASLPKGAGRQELVPIGPSAGFSLRPPAAGPAFSTLSRITVAGSGGTEESFLGAAESGGGKVRIAVLSLFGQTLFTAVWDGAAAATRSSLPPSGAPFDPRLTLALLQIAQWPAREVGEGLSRGLSLAEDGGRRTILRGNEEVLTVDREGGGPPFQSVLFRRPSDGWTMAIETLEE